MSWIETVDAKAATGRLREIHDRIAGSEGAIDNVLQTHSLRSHTLEGLARRAGDDCSTTRPVPRAKMIFHWLYARARRQAPVPGLAVALFAAAPKALLKRSTTRREIIHSVCLRMRTVIFLMKLFHRLELACGRIWVAIKF